MRVVTWNVNSVKPRMPRLLDWVEKNTPDVLLLQETKCSASEVPTMELQSLGYEVAAAGDGRWNGVAVVSRVGLDDVITEGFVGQPRWQEALEGRAIGATCGGVRVWSVYVPNGRSVDDPHYAYKLAWLAAFRTALEGEPRPLLVGGDFNIAPTDDDVWDPKDFVTSTHVTPAERAALAAILDLGLTDLQPRISKGKPFTYWDYRAGMFQNGKGMRIDLLLVSPELAAVARDTWVDREARKLGSVKAPAAGPPSDHAPLVVDLDLQSA